MTVKRYVHVSPPVAPRGRKTIAALLASGVSFETIDKQRALDERADREREERRWRRKEKG